MIHHPFVHPPKSKIQVKSCKRDGEGNGGGGGGEEEDRRGTCAVKSQPGNRSALGLSALGLPNTDPISAGWPHYAESLHNATIQDSHRKPLQVLVGRPARSA